MNLNNTADEFELQAIEWFKNNPNEKERFMPIVSEDGEESYHYTWLIWGEKSPLFADVRPA